MTDNEILRDAVRALTRERNQCEIRMRVAEARLDERDAEIERLKARLTELGKPFADWDSSQKRGVRPMTRLEEDAFWEAMGTEE